MKFFKVPPNPSYYLPHCSQVAVDGTFLYISFTQIFGIEEKDGVIDTFSLETGAKVLAFDCDPDFSRSRYVATSSDDKHVWIWDLDTKKAFYGHTAHIEKAGSKHSDRDNLELLPLCFTINKKVLSIHKHRFVIYCVASNTYKIVVNFLPKHEVTIMRASPYNSDVVVLGTKAGLILIMSLKSKNVLYTMRGHDTEIRTLDWVKLRPEEQVEEDLFDMYKCDELEEFGVATDKTQKHTDEVFMQDDTFRAKSDNMNHTKFDFTEACESLRHQILGENEQNAEEKCEKQRYFEEGKKTETFSDISNSFSNEDDEESEEIKKLEIEQNEDEITCVVSSAHESTVWIWDAKTGRSIDRIQFPVSNKSFKTKTTVAKWLNKNLLACTDMNGTLQLWNTEVKDQNRISLRKQIHEFTPKAVIDIAVDTKADTFWVTSMHGQITCFKIGQNDTLIEYATISSRVHCFAVNPIDPNKIAIAANKKISLLNVSNINEKRFVFGSMSNFVKSQVLSLAWHPKKENYLAFTTKEGRVGVFDVANFANSPNLMKPFFNNEVYSVTWGYFRANITEEKDYVLFCCGFSGKKGHLVYFPQQGNRKNVAIELRQFQNVTAVLASQDYLAIGTFDGHIYICDLNDPELTPFYEQKISAKLISAFDYKGAKHLAVGSFDHDITIVSIQSKSNVQLVKLKGHAQGVNYVNWDLNKDNLLVSASNDCTVRVWDIETESCLSVSTFEREVYSAIFVPLFEDTIIVGGLDVLITLYNYKTAEVYRTKSGKPPKKPSDAIMAKANDVNVGAKMKNERKLKKAIEKQLQLESEPTEHEHNGNLCEEVLNTEELNTKMLKIKLDSESNENKEETNVSKKEVDSSSIHNDNNLCSSSVYSSGKPIKLNYSTFFFETHRELNRNPVGLIKQILSEKKDDISKLTNHEKLMSTNYDDVKSLLQDELKNLKTANIRSVGHTALPLFTADIKSVILEKIDSKNLTEEDLSVAPFVSHSFWKDCCEAFAYQCVEQNLTLKAVSYFLCCHEVKQAIAALCKQNYFAEAMALAKLRCPCDSIIKVICEKWTAHLDYCGNYEGAAVIWILYGDHQEALNVLERRINPNEELKDVLEALKLKVATLK